MGTRSLTFVYEAGQPVVNMYRQFDGYLSGHGRELSGFLSNRTVINGIGSNQKDMSIFSNGMSCLAASMVAMFKKETGGFYLYPTDIKDCGQDYEYHIYENRVIVKAYEKEIFDGTWSQFESFCYEEETE